MRVLGAVILVVAAAFACAARSEPLPQSGATAKAGPHSGQFRRSGVRRPSLRARAAGRRGSPDSHTAEQGGSRTASANARKRAPSAPFRGSEQPRAVADRLALQFDLAWTGDYVGLVTGELNEKTTAAIKAFQKNRKFKETGTLNTQERALLAASAKAKQAQVGWSMIDDPATGARLGLAGKQIPNKSEGKSGTRWSSAQGQVQVETFRIREPGTTLASAYERQKKEPATRRIELNVLRDNYFVLSGMQGLKKFFVRGEFKDGEVRGVTVLYDQATENIMDPVAVVMASAFTGFPKANGVAQLGTAQRRTVEYGTGIFVSAAGHILTDRQLTDGCQVVVASGFGDADRQAEDPANDLALLRVYGVPDLAPAEFAESGDKEADVTLLGIADPQSQAGGGAISAMAGRLKAGAIEPAPQLGFSGAAVLDRQNHLVGMAGLRAPMMAAAGASAAQPQAFFIAAGPIRTFLQAQQVPPPLHATGDGAKVSVVRVICVRK